MLVFHVMKDGVVLLFRFDVTKVEGGTVFG